MGDRVDTPKSKTVVTTRAPALLTNGSVRIVNSLRLLNPSILFGSSKLVLVAANILE